MRGGSRKGAGRPRGAATKRSRKIADRESQAGITPLEVMLKAMRAYVDKDDLDAAASIAKDAAPYMHAKLASVQHKGSIGTYDLSKMSDDELDRLEAILGPLALDGGNPSGESETEG